MSTSQITYINPSTKSVLQQTEKGLVDKDNTIFPFVNGAYRFVPAVNYTSNFGFQWNKFKKTQIDKSSGLNISKERFFAATDWDKESLENKNILEVGSGAGRFSQIVLDFTQANLYSIDYSNAVEANFQNNGNNPRLKLFQASAFELPFADNSFEKVFCFGVLQHTGNPEKAINEMHRVLKKDGELIVDFYPYKGFWTKLHAKYILRPFLKNKSDERLLKLITRNIDWMIGLHKFFNIIKVGKLFNRFIPICDITNTHPKNLSKQEQREWAILDTFDMFSPVFDEPLKVNKVVQWFNKLNMKKVWGGCKMYSEKFQVYIVKGIK